MTYLELEADNTELVYAVELSGFEQMVLGMMGYEPDTFAVYVFRSDEGVSDAEKEAQTLAEVAPLHQEFFSDEDSASKRANDVLEQINNGTFVYSPPALPEDADQF